MEVCLIDFCVAKGAFFFLLKFLTIFCLEEEINCLLSRVRNMTLLKKKSKVPTAIEVEESGT